jgi:hypothetical protein
MTSANSANVGMGQVFDGAANGGKLVDLNCKFYGYKR